MGNGKKDKTDKSEKKRDADDAAPAPAEFNLDDPVLPDWVRKRAFGSGDFPIDEPMDDETYLQRLVALQIELVKLQQWTIKEGRRVVIVFEGRDAAGKGGAIGAFREYMSPRATRIVALAKPTDAEKGQWYFQRYIQHLPTRGEITLFDRSWYNRAGVEPVMGFCTPAETEAFLADAPRFERMLAHAGTTVVKIWIDVGREMQLKRFHDRRHNPLKVWKVSPIDYAAISRYDAYGAARDRMIEATHTDEAPWFVVLGNDKKRARLAAIQYVLGRFDYPDKDRKVIGEIDARIASVGRGVLD
ncbi:MAG: polyphosphate kinase 2 [Hyphomicrobiaceae bacterium]|nr:polyphosphate kinase 2 [Hyphomicrobiaceae bacterium]